MFRWLIKKVCTHGGGCMDHRKVPCSPIWRPLWSIPHTRQNLAMRILLANNVWRHQRIHLKVSKMLAVRWHHLSQCNAPPLQSSNRNIWCVGHWLHGTVSKVPRLWVHPRCCWLHIKMGGSTTLPSYWRQACKEDVPWSNLPLLWNTWKSLELSTTLLLHTILKPVAKNIL